MGSTQKSTKIDHTYVGVILQFCFPAFLTGRFFTATLSNRKSAHFLAASEGVAMTQPNENREPTDSQAKPLQRSRRGLFKAGAMLIPTLVTLRAQPLWAQTGPTGYVKAGTNHSKRPK